MSLYNHGVSSAWWQDVARERKKRGKYKESDGLVNREVIFKTNQYESKNKKNRRGGGRNNLLRSYIQK